MEEELPATKEGWAATVLTVGVLALLILFTVRVVFFMNGIRSGTLDVSSLAFRSSLTTLPKASGSVALPPAVITPVDRVDAPSLGPKDASLRVVVFADFDCPFSREANFAVRPVLQTSGKHVQYVYRHFPIEELHPGARRVAEASECANAQGKFWEYNDKLYLNLVDHDDVSLIRYATELGLDKALFATCLTDGTYAARVEADYQAGLAAGVAGTPTSFFNGSPIPGAIPADIFEQLIAQFAPS